jgi:hypothetical protein
LLPNPAAGRENFERHAGHAAVEFGMQALYFVGTGTTRFFLPSERGLVSVSDRALPTQHLLPKHFQERWIVRIQNGIMMPIEP